MRFYYDEKADLTRKFRSRTLIFTQPTCISFTSPPLHSHRIGPLQGPHETEDATIPLVRIFPPLNPASFYLPPPHTRVILAT